MSGRVGDLDLVWGPVNSDYSVWRAAPYNGPDHPVGQFEPAEGLIWIAKPTFEPDVTQRDAYRAMFAALAADRARVLNPRAVVIDLRANQGGSSDWSLDLAAVFWGQGRVDRALDAYGSDLRTWWRASNDNTQYVTHLIDVLKEEKQTSMAEQFAPVAAGMAAALGKSQPYFVQPADPPAPHAKGNVLANFWQPLAPAQTPCDDVSVAAGLNTDCDAHCARTQGAPIVGRLPKYKTSRREYGRRVPLRARVQPSRL